MNQGEIEQLIYRLTLDSSEFENEYDMLLQAGEEAISPLMDSLHSDDHNQHHMLASILCDILVEVGDNDALELLYHLINHPKNSVFTPAVRSLAQLKLPQVNQVLCELLDHPAPQVRRVVAWQLGRNQAIESESQLVQHLVEVDLETLRGIIWSLGQIGDSQTIRFIEPFTQHLSNDISFMAQEAIERITNKALN